ncbi:hypothetical protein H0H81_012119, partial [Sphagnurus paluster]
MRIDHARLAAAIEEADVASAIPKIGLGPITEIEGLHLHTGILCVICKSVYRKQSAMTKHHQEAHQDRPQPETWPSVFAQQLRRGQDRTFFHVLPRTIPNPSENEVIIATLRSQQIELDGVPSGDMLDPRLLSPWLKSTHWLKLIEGKDVSQLMALVAIPDQKFPGLTAAVRSVFEIAEESFERFPELALQRLNSPYPIK